MKTLGQYPLLIGEILRRAEARRSRREAFQHGLQTLGAYFCLCRFPRRPRLHVAKFSPKEIVISPRL